MPEIETPELEMPSDWMSDEERQTRSLKELQERYNMPGATRGEIELVGKKRLEVLRKKHESTEPPERQSA